MWRHIPKIVVLSAIGVMVLTFYFTQWNGSPARGGQPPNVVYINQGVSSAGR
jgi:hypothetical protein